MIPINYFAVLVCVVINMIVGALWYSPLLFGKVWMRLMGFDERTREEMSNMKKGVQQKYLFMAIASLITSLVMAIFIQTMDIHTILGGFRVGFLTWVGFAATAQFANWVFSGKKVDLFIIQTTYPLVVYCLSGIILALWK